MTESCPLSNIKLAATPLQTKMGSLLVAPCMVRLHDWATKNTIILGKINYPRMLWSVPFVSILGCQAKG